MHEDASDELISIEVRPWMPSWLRALVVDQRFLFLVIGGVNTVVGLSWFLVLHLTWPSMNYLATLMGSYALGTLSAFALHRRFVFRVTGNVVVDFLRFCLVTSGGLGLNALLLLGLVELARLAVLPAQFVATAMTVVLTYFAHASFSFRRGAAHEHPEERVDP